MSCCLYWVILEERPSVRVLASAVDDCLPAASSVHYTTSCKHSLALPRMGEIIARNRLS